MTIFSAARDAEIPDRWGVESTDARVYDISTATLDEASHLFSDTTSPAELPDPMTRTKN